MKYKLYQFTGLTRCDGTTESIGLYQVIKKYDNLFLGKRIIPVNPKYETPEYSISTLTLLEDKLFCFEADYYEMESIKEYIEDGFVIVPFSRTFFIMDLIPYYKQGLDVIFMTIKEYKQFKKDYADSLITVEDKTNQELF